MFDEKLVTVLQNAFQNSINALKKEHNENFYYFGFIFDEGMHPYISAWSYEAYEKSLKENEIDDADKDWWKWDYSDSPYVAYEHETYFAEADEILNEIAAKLSEDELYDTEWYTIMESMEEALSRLNKLNFFGTEEERKQVIINVEQVPPDETSGERERAKRLNPQSSLLDEYLEMCEDDFEENE
ncbi:MAG: DUF4303 domain-containing protein [Firmicutes bacterium]|nr:DUF4303 domain-containing protein [Bacillota bacterium]MBQ9603780.1 DUF4303 domain-containing protein [Bacillota bacterium]